MAVTADAIRLALTRAFPGVLFTVAITDRDDLSTALVTWIDEDGPTQTDVERIIHTVARWDVLDT